jgi:hypothetical protein
MKNVAMVGSRRRTDRQTVDRLVAQLPKGTVIVSGGPPVPTAGPSMLPANMVGRCE